LLVDTIAYQTLDCCRVTFTRIQDFLTSPELRRRPEEDDAKKDEKYAIIMKNATFSYSPEDAAVHPAISNASFKARQPMAVYKCCCLTLNLDKAW